MNSNFINSLNDPNNLVVLSFDILKNLFGKYVEFQIKNYYINDQWVQVLYQGVQVSVSELLDQNCFIVKNDLKTIINIFLRQWDDLFCKKCLNIVPVNLVNILNYQIDQIINGYSFSFREVYKIIDYIELLLELLDLNIQDINNLRGHTLMLLSLDEMSFKQNNFNKFTKKDSNVEMASYHEIDQYGNLRLNDNYLNNKGAAINNLYNKYTKN